jgi:hypothetical protein
MRRLINTIDHLMSPMRAMQYEGKDAKAAAEEARRIVSLLSVMMEQAGYGMEYSSKADEWVVWVEEKTGGAVTLWKNPKGDWQLISGVPEMAKLSTKPYAHKVDLLRDPKRKENREALRAATAIAEKVMDKTREGTLTKDFAPQFSAAIRARKDMGDPGGAAAMGEEMAFDMHKQAQALYLKGWDEHPSPNGKRLAYGRTLKLGSVDVPLRIIQEDDAGKAWRVDRKGLPTWEAMFDGKEFRSAAAAGQAVAGWWKQVEAAFERLTKDGYRAHEAAFKALSKVREEDVAREGRAALPEAEEMLYVDQQAGLAVGQTIERDNLRMHRYNSSLRVTDVTNAGKRGKKCPEFALFNLDYGQRDPKDVAKINDALKAIVKAKTYAQAVAIARGVAAKDSQRGMSFASIEERDLRGVDVEPMAPSAGSAIQVETPTFKLKASRTEFDVMEKPRPGTDGQDVTAVIPPVGGAKKTAIARFYAWVGSHQAEIKGMTFRELLRAMAAADLDYHAYSMLD